LLSILSTKDFHNPFQRLLRKEVQFSFSPLLSAQKATGYSNNNNSNSNSTIDHIKKEPLPPPQTSTTPASLKSLSPVLKSDRNKQFSSGLPAPVAPIWPAPKEVSFCTSEHQFEPTATVDSSVSYSSDDLEPPVTAAVPRSHPSHSSTPSVYNPMSLPANCPSIPELLAQFDFTQYHSTSASTSSSGLPSFSGLQIASYTENTDAKVLESM
jgi:hypothetical protein